MPLGQRAEGRELLQRPPLLGAPSGEVSRAVQRPQQLESGQLGPPDRVARDPIGLGVRPQRIDGRADVVRRRGVLGRVLDVQREDGAEPARGRRVRRGVDRLDRRLGVQRVEQHHAGALGRHRVDEGAQVGVVAHRPRIGAAQAVELHHPAPRPVLDARQSGRGDDQHRFAGQRVDSCSCSRVRDSGEPVPAERQLGQRDAAAHPAVAAGGDGPCQRHGRERAVLLLDDQLELGLLRQVHVDRAATSHDQARRQQPLPRRRLGLLECLRDRHRRVCVDVEGGQRRDDRRRRDRCRPVRPSRGRTSRRRGPQPAARGRRRRGSGSARSPAAPARAPVRYAHGQIRVMPRGQAHGAGWRSRHAVVSERSQSHNAG